MKGIGRGFRLMIATEDQVYYNREVLADMPEIQNLCNLLDFILSWNGQ